MIGILQVSGFSGTNDDHVIVPTTLSWIEQKDLSLVGTDGKMVHLLQKSHFQELAPDAKAEESITITLEGDVENSAVHWTSLLDFVISKINGEKGDSHRTCALIDAGALMAGE